MTATLPPILRRNKRLKTHGFFEDFNLFVNALNTATEQSGWRLTDTDDGTCTGTGTAGGQVDILVGAGAADNESAILHTDEEVFLIAADKPIKFGCRIKWTEANTDDANVAVGLTTHIDAAATLGDNGIGPSKSVTQDTVCFFKVDSRGPGAPRLTNSWSAYTQMDDATSPSVGVPGEFRVTELTQDVALNGKNNVHSGSFQVLEFVILPFSSTSMDVIFRIDGEMVCKHTNVTMTTPAAMYPFACVKNGDTNDETITLDWMYCFQTR